MITVGIGLSNLYEGRDEYVLEFPITNSRILSTAYMFKDCKNLKQVLTQGTPKTYKIKSAEGMFEGCESLEEIDLSNYNFSECKDFSFMFKDCVNLRHVIFGRYYIDPLAEVEQMFYNCPNIDYIEIPYECRVPYGNIIGQANWRVQYYDKKGNIKKDDA